MVYPYPKNTAQTALYGLTEALYNLNRVRIRSRIV